MCLLVCVCVGREGGGSLLCERYKLWSGHDELLLWRSPAFEWGNVQKVPRCVLHVVCVLHVCVCVQVGHACSMGLQLSNIANALVRMM